MARARQDWLQLGPALVTLGSALVLPAFAAPASAQVSPRLVAVQAQLAPPVAANGSGTLPGASLVQVMDNGIVPRKGSSCPLVVPSQVDFLQPKRLKPEEVKAKNAAGCLSPADAIYGADGCPLKLCPNPQWQGL
ncbi:MAG: hypothetical protein NTZ53_02755 [Cyanobacteria bacterium]|nr:hypothetical protein [Cyanobacteriota bacterium]